MQCHLCAEKLSGELSQSVSIEQLAPIEGILINAIGPADSNQKVSGEPDTLDLHASPSTDGNRQNGKRDRNAFAADEHSVEVAIVWIEVVVALAFETELMKQKLGENSPVPLRGGPQPAANQRLCAEAVQGAADGMLLDKGVGFLGDHYGDVLDPNVRALQYRHQRISTLHNSDPAIMYNDPSKADVEPGACYTEPGASLCVVPVLDEFLHTLEHGPHDWAYALVLGAAAIEYVFPPLPGDTVALFAIVLAVRAQLHWALVYLALTAGALLGGLLAWGFGLWLAKHEQHWPRFLKTRASVRALDAVRRGYEKHGSMYLAVNRFLPALRAFFFLGAGLSRMSVTSVIVYGGLSAALWNALLMAVGYAVGSNWDVLRDLTERYTIATLILIGIVVAGVVARFVYDLKRS
jgi:membrane protein DedA with SNARE-associated domain